MSPSCTSGFINGNIRMTPPALRICAAIFSGRSSRPFGRYPSILSPFGCNPQPFAPWCKDPGFDGNFDVVRVEELNDGSQLVVARLVDESGVKFHHVDAQQRV